MQREFAAVRDDLECQWQRSPRSRVAELWQVADRIDAGLTDARRLAAEVRRAASVTRGGRRPRRPENPWIGRSFLDRLLGR
jgi:hypothetical protein